VKRHLRSIAYALLIAVSVYYGYRFFGSDWPAALNAWRERGGIVLLAIGVNLAGVAMDALCWHWTYARLGVRVPFALALPVYFTVHAAAVMPLQAGRLVRPDAAARAADTSLASALRAEAVLFYFDVSALGMSILALNGWLAATWLGFPPAAPGTAMLALGAALCGTLTLASLLAPLLLPAAHALPPGFWWHRQTLGILLLRCLDWCCVGMVLYLLLRGLEGAPEAPRAMLTALVSNFAGAGSGLPGGIGATEGVLGWLLQQARLPAAHLALSVALYRLITFWMLIPLGWLALLWANAALRRSGR
jgi:uncharacterized membrane protein YbhN (UPF0104 family)